MDERESVFEVLVQSSRKLLISTSSIPDFLTKSNKKKSALSFYLNSLESKVSEFLNRTQISVPSKQCAAGLTNSIS